MKAIVCTKYGSPDVLELQDVEKPSPGDNEVLIRVVASSVTKADTMMRRGTPFYARLFLGLTKPKHPVTGTGFAGVVEEAGKEVSRFKRGDAVFGETGVQFGANAEYVCLSQDGLLLGMPDTLTYEESAPLCDGPVTSMNFLRKIGNLQAGQKVLINGASGSLGTAAVQLARHFGAEVTGVCSGKNAEMVRSLGADHIVDYTEEDFTHSGKAYDLIFDTVGKSSFPKCKKILKPGGAYLCPVLSMPLLFQMLWTSQFGSRKAKFSATGLLPVPELKELLKELKELIDDGKLKMVMDREYRLEDAIEAHRYVDSGRKKGNVIITMRPESRNL